MAPSPTLDTAKALTELLRASDRVLKRCGRKEKGYTMTDTKFWNDKEIATQLRLSLSWVRKQRWLRRHGKEHVFTVDPVMIGAVPRYRHEDVQSWIDGLEGLQGRADAV